MSMSGNASAGLVGEHGRPGPGGATSLGLEQDDAAGGRIVGGRRPREVAAGGAIWLSQPGLRGREAADSAADASVIAASGSDRFERCRGIARRQSCEKHADAAGPPAPGRYRPLLRS